MSAEVEVLQRASPESKVPATAVREFFYYADGGLYRRVQAGAANAHDRAGSVGSRGRRYISMMNMRFSESRMVWAYHHGAWPVGVIDHIDGQNGSGGTEINNRIANLRDVSQSTNLENQRRPQRHNTSGLLGVIPRHPKGRGPRASITVCGVVHYLGTFDTAEQAHAAYLEAKRRLHKGNTL